MERNETKRVLEAILFVTDRPVTLKELREILEAEEGEVLATLEEIRQELTARNSAVDLKEVANGYQFATRPEFFTWIQKLYKDRLTYRLSTSAMETLSIVAYKQPITRSEVEEIRGVEITAVLETLLERKLIRIVGRKETVGRPLLYGTTPDFLKSFNLKRLSDLPAIDTLAPPAEEAPVVNVPETPETAPETPGPADLPPN